MKNSHKIVEKFHINEANSNSKTDAMKTAFKIESQKKSYPRNNRKNCIRIKKRNNS